MCYYLLCVSPGLIPDKEVRVSVKALALSCVGAAAALHPEAFFNSLYLEPLDGVPVVGKNWGKKNKKLLLSSRCLSNVQQ